MSSRHLLITGSTIGLALAEAFAAEPSVDRITLTWHKKPLEPTSSKIQLRQVDLTLEGSIESAFSEIDQLDGVINTVGILHGDNFGPEKTIRRFDPEQFLNSMALNCLPTLTLAKYAGPLLKKSPSSFFTSLSARVGSIGDNRSGGWYSYRTSKAALNMAIKNIAIEWGRTMPRCTVAGLHPGTVETPLSKPFVKENQPGLFTPEDSAQYLKAVLDQLTPEQTGQLFAWDGQVIPW